MIRPWKLAVAVFFIGVIGFTIRTFLVAAKPVLTLRFTGYETNIYAAATGGSPTSTRIIFAVFVMSNGSPRPILCLSNSGTATWAANSTSSSNQWIRGPGGQLVALSAPVAKPVGHALDPTKAGKIFVAVRDFDQPMRTWVTYQNVPRANRFWDRLPPQWRWPNWPHSVETTIQER